MDHLLRNQRLSRTFRLVRDLYRADPTIKPTRICLDLIGGAGPGDLQAELVHFKGDEFDYVLASIYALLLPASRRKELGAYFTPPHLVHHLLKRMREYGFDAGHNSVHDPAAGGAAFIVPLVRATTRALLEATIPRHGILAALAERLSGKELDQGLAAVANALVARTLRLEFGIKVPAKFRLIRVGNSLVGPAEPKDAVIGNPPYGKVGAQRQREWAAAFADILGGQLNLYAMFLRRSMDQVRPGGLVGFVVPTSFLQGPEFRTLRVALLARADLLQVDLIEKRTGLFLDVVQDTCSVVFRRIEAVEKTEASLLARCAVLQGNGIAVSRGNCAVARDGSPWMLPAPMGEPRGGSVLADYGYRCSVGYLVVNRQKDRLGSEAGEGKVPLVRAGCVRMDGRFDLAAHGLEYVTVPDRAKYVVRNPCVVIQRTANRKQPRMLNAAAIPPRVFRDNVGVVGENHVLFCIPVGKPKVSPALMANIMNSAPVNERWGRMCGTISLSAKLLAELDLPDPDLVAGLKGEDRPEFDAAIAAAYGGRR